MSALAKILVTFIFVVVLFWISIGNRGEFAFSLPPFIDSYPVPVALLMLAAMVLGFLWGGAVVWLNGAVTRGENRKQRKEIKILEQAISKKDASL